MISNRQPGLSRPELKRIIAEERVFVQFQSILSARNHTIIGFEGLIRGRTRDGKTIPPVVLFDAAQKHDMTLAFDRFCRERVLAAFAKIYLFRKNSLLFLNLETSFLSSKVVGSGYLLDQVTRHKIPPSSIVIEIVESKTTDTDALNRFVGAYRMCGFSIALDDVGTGHSNFDRISLLRPNIIKVDRSIISGMATNYFKQEIFKSLTNLSTNIGCLTLAEGVETQDEVLACIGLGADLLQGYFFSRPRDIGPQEFHDEEKKLERLLYEFRERQINFVKARRLQNKQYQKTLREIVRKIEGKPLKEIEAVLRDAIVRTDTLDAAYVVNGEGIQITNTILRKNRPGHINPVFRAASKNENLSHKDYIYQVINTDLRRYTTNRYISFATGNLCVTLSCRFKGRENLFFILCLDFFAGNR